MNDSTTYELPWKREYTSVYAVWTGANRTERIILSPAYLILVLVLWFRGCFLAQDHTVLRTRPVEEGDSE